MEKLDPKDVATETLPKDLFLAPSIQEEEILAGRSYTYHSPVPKTVIDDRMTECVLGVDEAGRGPVLGIESSYPLQQ